MNPAEIDALVASVQATKSAPMSSLAESAIDAAAQAPQLTDFISPSLGATEVPINILLDLTLPVAIELGRTNMTVQEILRLGRGSVVQLDRLAGEPIDIYVGDRRFAEGEVVVLGEHFGVRITRIHSTKPAANAA
jgi:flagellar motor switch protein FliN/FliY